MSEFRQHDRLQHLVEKGERCVMFFLIQRTDAEAFAPADHIDPAYGRELRKAADKGVELLASGYNFKYCFPGFAARLRGIR
ncbi:MAG: DNA/RNA nuclease SfsA [Desulfobacterales bacterium]|nr:DNA/RNA nuclease SfsA [Desulfobacterales bacterium]